MMLLRKFPAIRYLYALLAHCKDASLLITHVHYRTSSNTLHTTIPIGSLYKCPSPDLRGLPTTSMSPRGWQSRGALSSILTHEYPSYHSAWLTLGLLLNRDSHNTSMLIQVTCMWVSVQFIHVHVQSVNMTKFILCTVCKHDKIYPKHIQAYPKQAMLGYICLG